MSKIIGYVMLVILFGLILGVVIHIAGLIPALFIVGGALFMTLWVVIAIGLTSGGLQEWYNSKKVLDKKAHPMRGNDG